jgi:hypothetical protein
MRAQVPAVRGTTDFRSPPTGNTNAIGWGNHSSTCLDPTLIWTCQEYANSTVEREWCTASTAYRLGEHKKTRQGGNALGGAVWTCQTGGGGAFPARRP